MTRLVVGFPASAVFLQLQVLCGGIALKVLYFQREVQVYVQPLRRGPEGRLYPNIRFLSVSSIRQNARLGRDDCVGIAEAV